VNNREISSEFYALRAVALEDGRDVPLPIEANGLKLEIFADPTEESADYLQYRALLTLPNGEVREQHIAGQRFARGWLDTAIRRMTERDPDSITPQTIVSMKWDD
jgi:hypothetical protein